MSCDSFILSWKYLCNLIVLLWFELTIEDSVSFTKKSSVIINVSSLEYICICIIEHTHCMCVPLPNFYLCQFWKTTFRRICLLFLTFELFPQPFSVNRSHANVPVINLDYWLVLLTIFNAPIFNIFNISKSHGYSLVGKCLSNKWLPGFKP